MEDFINILLLFTICSFWFSRVCAVDNSQYVGCYDKKKEYENGSPEAFENRTGSGHGSVDACVSKCIQIGYTHAGSVNREYCWCGNGFIDYGTNESKCGLKCKDNEDQICGGDGWLSIYKTECPAGYWGASVPVCEYKCGQCADNQCNITHGTCPSGCKDGWDNHPWCDRTTATTTTTSTTTNPTTTAEKHNGTKSGNMMQPNNTGVVVGATVGCLLLILIIATIILGVVFRERILNFIRKKKVHDEEEPVNDEPTISKSRRISERLPFLKVLTKGFEENEDKPVEYTNSVLSNPVKLENLQQLVKVQMASSEPFKQEYQHLPRSRNYPCSVAEQPSLKPKNRFKDILPYDESRVVLTQINDDPLSDYINASYINGYSSNQRFIAAQGPNKDTLNDFWRMIWENKVTNIIMLTKLVEMGKRKCSQYWPEKGNQSYGDLKVTMDESHIFPDFCIRNLTVKNAQSSRNVKMFHFTSWPDHGVPQHATPILNFHQKVKSEMGQQNKDIPVLIHCSAGIGRTGAYLAIDSLLQQAEAEKQIDVMKTVADMRGARPKMIQTREQYAFVYSALLESVWVGVTLIPCFQFHKLYEQMLNPDPYSSSTKLEEQFKMLKTMATKKKADCSVAKSSANKKKNRSKHILPDNGAYVSLMTAVEGRTDYINSVFVDGRRSVNKFIVTQLPLLETVVDFWRLVFDYKCPCIVAISKGQTQEQVVYWPSEGLPLDVGPFTVELNDQKDESGIRVRQINVTNPKRGESHSVTQINFSEWPEDDDSPGPQSRDLLKLYSLAQQWENISRGPTLVHCLDGVEQSGVYIAISNLCDMMSVEQELDVFQVVQTIRKNRSQFITSQAQYRYLYDTAGQYIESFGTYSNFR